MESVSSSKRSGGRRLTFTEAQIAAFLQLAESGVPVKDLCQRHGFSDTTFYKWRGRLAGSEPIASANRIRWLEEENKHLKKLLAQAMLDLEVLRVSQLRK